MAYKLLTRLGVLTGAIVGTTQMGIWSEPNSEAVPDMLKSSKSEKETDVKEICALAYKNCQLAIERGFYFSHRLPDWKREYLTHTANIMNDHVLQDNSRDLMLQLAKDKPRAALRNSHYAELAQIDDQKLPMIKDDVTCRKR